MGISISGRQIRFSSTCTYGDKDGDGVVMGMKGSSPTPLHGSPLSTALIVQNNLGREMLLDAFLQVEGVTTFL